MTGDLHVDVDRQAIAELISDAMVGHTPRKRELPFGLPSGTVKTYALEVNGTAGDTQKAAERAHDIARAAGLEFAATRDPALLLTWQGELGMVVDVLDPRFWLVHTTAPAGRVQQLLRSLVGRSTDMDWCWFPGSSIRRMQADGDTKWFKTDFRGDELLASQPVEARRLKVQLEGDQAQRLYELLAQTQEYKSSTALTAIAVRLGDGHLGWVDEAAYYRGRFVARGESFEVHLGFVSKWVQDYAATVRTIETEHRISWSAASDGGAYSFSGGPITVSLGRPIEDLDQFAAALFSCRDPFRLWAVPRSAGRDAIEAEVVDLHVGQQMRMDITREWIRVYLPENACGNTIMRLVSNLQHRYDASVVEPGGAPG
jgi:hypothetical protein